MWAEEVISNGIIPWLTPLGVYIHIPFCQHHCHYCDFAVTVGQDDLISAYLDALTIEITKLGRITPVQTIFIGGGTPSYLPPKELERLLRVINHWLPAPEGVPREFSIEATPESLTLEKIDMLYQQGVTRISLGVQTFNEKFLPVLDRIHRPNHIFPVLEQLRRYPLQISLDLMFGLPGQTTADWEKDLHQALQQGTHHLSTYGLTYEKGTPLWKKWKKGDVIACSEEEELEMYKQAILILQSANWDHYEISNFAKGNTRCRHNELYWANYAYYGFGVGAASYVEGNRQMNKRNSADYIQTIMSGDSAIFQSEKLSDYDRAWETIAIQLRRCEGINAITFAHQTGFSLAELIGKVLESLEKLNLVQVTDQKIALTEQGKPLADSIIAQIMKEQKEKY